MVNYECNYKLILIQNKVLNMAYQFFFGYIFIGFFFVFAFCFCNFFFCFSFVFFIFCYLVVNLFNISTSFLKKKVVMSID